ANGQRQAMFLENVSGFAERILRNYKLSDQDAALVISSSGTNIVPVEIAELFQKNNIKVVSIITKSHSEASKSKRADGKKLSDFSDIILDTGAPVGDAMIQIENLETPVAPGSTLGGVLLINSIKATVAAKLTKAGHPPTVLSAANKVGEQKAVELFEKAYDEHAIRLSKLYQF
ncbi:MAG: sugar isomerase domain-containing protein, partial [Chitinophagaceae bacterium]